MKTAILEAGAISLAWGTRMVLEGFSARFGSASLCAVLGANGSGKSTLLRALAGLSEPCAGEVRLDGKILSRMPARERARHIAWLPQNIPADWPFTVHDIASQGRFPHSGAFRPLSHQDQAVVEAALARCDLADLAQRPVTELSGGERQRAWIARALAQEADILLLDEPLSQLDMAHQKEIMELLAGLRNEGRRIVMALHDVNLALAYCDRAIVLSKGCSCGDGDPAQLLMPPLVRDAWGLDVARIPDPIRPGRDIIVW